MEPKRSSKILRFGPFDLDTSNGELRKHGIRVRLQDQPYKLLGCLLEARGEVVAREELIRAIWPEGTFVDYERGLNAAVTRIRQALGDSAEHPRYIETVARRGYRFIGTLEEVEAPAGHTKSAVDAPTVAEPETVSDTNAVPDSQQPQAPERVPTTSGSGRSRMSRVAATAAVVALLGAGAAVWMDRSGKNEDTELIQLTQDSGLAMDPAVSPDGKLLAYVSDRAGGRMDLWVQQLVPGGTSVQLTHGDADVREPAFSPDGSKIAFRSQKQHGGIYVVPTIGGKPVQIVPDGSTPRFSPDGKWISFWVGTPLSSFPDGGDWGTAYIVPASGGEPKRVGADLKYGAYPVWSPDSQHLLVYVNPVLRMPAVDQDWWLISVDGSASRRTGAFAALDRQKIRISDGYVPRAYDWTAEGILFTGTLADTVNCWQVPGPDANGRINGPAERLTEGTTLEVSPVFKGERLFFASLTRAQNIWAVDADTDRGVVRGVARRLTGGGAELGPSISEDGTQLAFTSSRTKEVDVRLKDLTTGQERTVANSAGAEMRPRITWDGSAVAYTLWQTGNDEIRVVPASGGASKRITSGSGFVWWANKERLLFTKRFSDHAILMADLASGKEKVLLEMADHRVFQASFSRDERWLVAEVTPREKQFSLSRIYIIPAAQNAPVSEQDWIPVGHETGWNDKPRWSPDGNSIYFISHEDGFRCLWTQRLDPKTKRPTSPPAAVYHLHDTRVSMLNVGLGMLEIDVAKDKIVFGMGELTGNIWSRNSK